MFAYVIWLVMAWSTLSQERGIRPSPACPRKPLSLALPASPLTGSSTVDLLIYQTLCYTHDELRDVNVGDFVLKPCGLEEFLQK